MTYELRSPIITFAAALRDLASSSARVRSRAAHALGEVVAPDERSQAVDALIGVLRDPRPEVRAPAAIALGELDGQAAVAPLLERMDDNEPAVRQAAVIALGKLGFASAFEPLARALREGPPDVRFQAATSLAEIAPDRAAEPLMAALEDSDGEVVGAAAVALGALGVDAAREPLWRRVTDWERPATRFDLAYALADLGDARAIDVLSGFVEDKALAWDAIEALEKCGQPRAAASLTKLLGQRRIQPRIRLRAAAAILALDGDQDDSTGSAAAASAEERAGAISRARGELVAGLRLRKLEERGLAVDLLTRVGGPWAAAPLEELRRRRAGKHVLEEIDEALARIRAQELDQAAPAHRPTEGSP